MYNFIFLNILQRILKMAGKSPVFAGAPLRYMSPSISTQSYRETIIATNKKPKVRLSRLYLDEQLNTIMKGFTLVQCVGDSVSHSTQTTVFCIRFHAITSLAPLSFSYHKSQSPVQISLSNLSPLDFSCFAKLRC